MKLLTRYFRVFYAAEAEIWGLMQQENHLDGL